MNKLYSVSTNLGKPMIIDASGAASISDPIVPLLATAGQNHPLKFALGNAAFAGGGSSHVQAAVPHGLGVTPSFVAITPALQNFSGAGWGGTIYQYAGADGTNFYVAADGTAVPGSNPTSLYTFAAGYSYFFNWLALVLVY